VAHHCGGRRDRSASINRASVKKLFAHRVGKIRLQVIVDAKEQRKKMNTEQVAKKVVELVSKQAWYEALDTLYDDNIVSLEAFSMGGGSPETRGKEGVRGKIDWWVNAMEVHSFTPNGPFVAHDRFVVQYDADVTDKNSNQRRKLSEVGVYTVKDGKIVREEFLPRTD
jgi:hypothetical protein